MKCHTLSFSLAANGCLRCPRLPRLSSASTGSHSGPAHMFSAILRRRIATANGAKRCPSVLRSYATPTTYKPEPDPQLNGYPELPNVSKQRLPPTGWWDQQNRRDFGETVNSLRWIFDHWLIHTPISCTKEKSCTQCGVLISPSSHHRQHFFSSQSPSWALSVSVFLQNTTSYLRYPWSDVNTLTLG
jgi:hypothetical protein